MAKAKILAVRMEVVPDEDPDLSFLGEYSNTPDTKRGYIDRKERGDMGRNEFRYFNAGCGDPAYIEKDYERMEAYYRGDWHMTGVRAAVDVRLKSGTIHRLKSGGLWGVESDCGDDYRREVFQEELRTLMGDLEDLGITAAEVTKQEVA